MNPPYDVITAECDDCGEFVVKRKPKDGKAALSTDGRDNTAWRQVVCKSCRMWADVMKVEEVRA